MRIVLCLSSLGTTHADILLERTAKTTVQTMKGKNMSNTGIDYGLGQTNVDSKTGIRFGVISVHSITQAWGDWAEADYGKPHCPECGEELKTATDGHCPFCDEDIMWEESCWPDEPIGWYVDDGEYKAVDCLDSDVMVIKSPYFTYAQFCSPCVPGAGNLNHPLKDGVKTYCFGHDWFDTKAAPYPVYSVETGERISPAN